MTTQAQRLAATLAEQLRGREVVIRVGQYDVPFIILHALTKMQPTSTLATIRVEMVTDGEPKKVKP